MEETKEAIKEKLKKFNKFFQRTTFVICIIVVITIIILSGAVYFITIDDGTYKEDDWSSTPYGASQYINGISMNEDGTLSSSSSAQELWDKMIQSGSRVDEYLDSPEELARLMKAEIVTKYPDLRENPEEEIDWKNIFENPDIMQGIIKFKRLDSNKKESIITYANPETFQGYIEEYNTTGSEKAKQNALSHFTLKKAKSSTSINYSGSDLYWPTDGTDITSYFGLRDNPLGGGTENHGAIDIAVPEGTNIYACEAGTVTIAGWSDSAGNWVVIDHGNGYVTKYMHNSQLQVSQGDTVKKGQVIALAGSTGWSTGPHCHFQVEYNGEKVDPLSFKYHNGMGENTGGFGISGSRDAEEQSKLYFIGDSWIAGLQNSGIAQSSYFYGKVGKHAGSPEMSMSSIPEKSDASAIVLYLGVNNPYTFDEMNSLIDNLSIKYNNKPIYVLEVSPVNTNLYTGSVTNEQIRDYNEKVKKHCSNKENVQFLEVASSVTDSNGMLTNTSDGLHLNSYDKWYNTIISEIESSSNTSGSSQKGEQDSTQKNADYVAVIATWKQKDISIQTNDPNVEARFSSQYTMTTTEINYEEMVDAYTMPFDLLWALLVVGEDKDFVFELADLVYGSDIEITIHDNLTVNTDIDEWHYTKRTKAVVNGTIRATIVGENASMVGTIIDDVHEPHGKDIPYTTIKTIITQTNTVDVALTKADVWIVDYQMEYTYVAPTETGDPITIIKNDEPYQDTPYSTGGNYSCEHITAKKNELRAKLVEYMNVQDGETANSVTLDGKTVITSFDENINVEYYYRYINIYDNVTNKIKTQKYIKGTPTLKEKVEKDAEKPNFVTIFNKAEYSRNKKRIVDVPSWLFEIIEKNDSTADMLDLIKYLLYMATGRNYGIQEFDFSSFDASKFKSVSGVSGTSLLSEFLKCWENGPLRDYLIGRADYNSSPYIYECITQDKQNYIMCDDLFTGNNNRNFGFGICFYVGSSGTFQNQNYFSDEGINIEDPKYQTYGVSTLSVEIVDRIKEKIIEDKRQEVRNIANAKGIVLTDYQVDALAALRYQGWYISDFLDAYKTYGMDPIIRNYSTGMGTSTDRYNANWELFSTGKYKDQYGNEIIVASSAGGGSILENAERIHAYMEDNDYFYSLDTHILKNTFEESKTSKGVCCATFVSWVLRDAGLIDQTSHSSSRLAELLENTYHWTRVSGSDLQPGDVMVYNYGHIEIYAGNGKIYNAGSDDAVKNAAPSNQWNTPDYGLRAP